MRFSIVAMAVVVAAVPVLAQQPKAHTKKEAEALQKVQADAQAGNYDAEINDINYVLENFVDTEFKAILLDWAVEAAESKGDYAQLVTFGQQAIQANPNDVVARVSLAENIAQHTRENDFDKEQKLKQVDEYAQKAIDLLKTEDNPPQGIAPDKWPAYRKQLTSGAYDALGQAAALRKKYPDSIQDYKNAIDADPGAAASSARLAKVYVDAKQYDDAIATADKVLAMNDAPAVVKQFAQQQKDAATRAKAAK